MTRALGILGLAMRAGQVVSGADMAEREIRAGRAALALLDAGASQRTQERVRALCLGRDVGLYTLREDVLGKTIGREGRMIAVVKKGQLATQMAALLENQANP